MKVPILDYNVRAPIQFRRERQSQDPKIRFFFENRPIHFNINNTRVIRPVNRHKLSFFSIEIENYFLPQSVVSRESGSSSQVNSSFCHKSDACSHLEQAA